MTLTTEEPDQDFPEITDDEAVCLFSPRALERRLAQARIDALKARVREKINLSVARNEAYRDEALF